MAISLDPTGDVHSDQGHCCPLAVLLATIDYSCRLAGWSGH